MITLKNNQIKKTSCPICRSSSRTFLYKAFDHEYLSVKQSFPFNKCKKCEVIYLSPRPNIKALEIIYPENYNNFSSATNSSYVKKISNYLQKIRIKRQITHYIKVEDFSILDVGCGNGFYLDSILDAFPKAKTFGIEQNTNASVIASRRHRIFNGLVEEYKSKRKFDLIILNHVIEHVENPIDLVRKLSNFLSNEGLLIISTPNIDSLQAKLFGKYWGGIHAPRHWTIFSIKTIKRLASISNFSVVEIKELPINIFWLWSLHSLFHNNYKIFANKYFHPTKAFSSKSIYYLFLLIFFEFFERLSGFFGFGMGQCLAVLKKNK